MFTERPLRELKNTFKKGSALEIKVSKKLHLDSTPVLVSANLLRKKGLGQIDLAILKEDKVLLWEIKNSPYLSLAQKSRLLKSAQFLAFVFKQKSSLVFYSEKEKYLAKSWEVE